MRTFTLIAAAIAAACVGCAPAASPPPPPPQAGAPTATCFDSVPKSVIVGPYDPVAANFAPPSSTRPLADQQELKDLNQAFAAAPPFFQNQLCGLKGVFIIPRPPMPNPAPPSWGFRNPSSVSLPTNRGDGYIGLSEAAIWPLDASANTAPAMALKDYANNEIAALLHQLNSAFLLPRPPEYSDPVLAPPGGPTGAMTVLAVLAHEYGHILWNYTFVGTPFSNPDFSSFCPAVWPTNSWNGATQRFRYRNFGDVADDPTLITDNDPSSDPDDPAPAEIRIDRLKALLNPGTPDHPATPSKRQERKARRIMARLVKAMERPWPSLFGAFSENEDFVETFRLYVLTHATPRLSNFLLSIPLERTAAPPVTADIPGEIADRHRLAKKLDCFNSMAARAVPR